VISDLGGEQEKGGGQRGCAAFLKSGEVKVFEKGKKCETKKKKEGKINPKGRIGICGLHTGR